MKKYLLIVLSILMFVGCSREISKKDVTKQTTEVIEQPEDQPIEEIVKADPYIGMSREEALNNSWGYPDEITHPDYMYSEEWIYDDGKVISFVGNNIKHINSNIQPYIGMTREEAYISKWGKPERINKTENTYGTEEQWCYDGYNYLYFTDGILTTIQE